VFLLQKNGSMREEHQQAVLATLHAIRDGQREIIQLLSAQRALAEEQISRSDQRIQKSVLLQELALQRQKVITAVALPSIGGCIIAIAYLVMRYF
jgi:hypothetical protein